MITEKRRTVTRTFRIPEDLSEQIDKEASQKRVNASSIINSMIHKYIVWDSYVKRYGFVSITKETFINLIKDLEKDEIVDIADHVTVSALQDFMQFRFEQLNVRSFLECVELIMTYGYIGEFEIRSDGPHYSIHIVHAMGKKVSLFLGHVFKGLLFEITGIESEYKISDNQVMIDFVAN